MNLDLIGNIDFLSVGIAIASMTIMGFSVLFNNYKNSTNRAFFYFVALGATWGFFHLMSYRITNNTPLAFLFLKVELFLAVWYVFSIFHFFYVFPTDKISAFSWWYKIILIPIVAIVSLSTLTPFVFSEVTSTTQSGAINTLETGPAFLPFLITIIGILVLSLTMFTIKTIHSTREEKNKFYLLLAGVIITFSLIIFFIPIQVGIFKNSNFIPFGAIFLLPFVLFASYAILRYKLFNIKIAGTAGLVFALAIANFIDILNTNPSDIVAIISRSTIMLLVLSFGILLLRGVLREVKLREQQEELTKNTQKLYLAEKKAEEELQKALLLEQKAKKELEELDKVKNQFLAQTQHDLRRPLGLIINMVDMMARGMMGKQTKKSLEVLERITAISQGKLKEVNTFLDTAQFQLGKKVVSLVPNVNLNSMLEEILTELLPEAESRKIYLKLDQPASPLLIIADREKLKSSIYNIIDNSIKFTSKGGVTMKASSENNVIRVGITDTGAGIKEDVMKKLFKETVDPLQHHEAGYTGKGMGLYLAGKVVEAHNGKIWAESKGEGQGAGFYIELPIDKQPQTDKN